MAPTCSARSDDDERRRVRGAPGGLRPLPRRRWRACASAADALPALGGAGGRRRPSSRTRDHGRGASRGRAAAGGRRARPTVPAPAARRSRAASVLAIAAPAPGARGVAAVAVVAGRGVGFVVVGADDGGGTDARPSRRQGRPAAGVCRRPARACAGRGRPRDAGWCAACPSRPPDGRVYQVWVQRGGALRCPPPHVRRALATGQRRWPCRSDLDEASSVLVTAEPAAARRAPTSTAGDLARPA